MYDKLVLGGTFDHFHSGHARLISQALRLSKHIVVGLTLPEMNREKSYSDTILPYEERKRELTRFVASQGRGKDLTVIPIHDVYGTTLTDQDLEAILVTPHSVKGAQLINLKRKERQMKELPIHVCELLSDDSGEILSSTRIREGQENRSGFVYARLFPKTLRVNDDVKEYVRKPLGEVHVTFPAEWPEVPLIFVGDIVSESAIKTKLSFSSAWIDGRSHREAYSFSVPRPYIKRESHLINAPGTIAKDVAIFMSQRLLSGKTVYQIEGEEDLLTLVAILLSPLGSQVAYGNPFGEKGITIVTVTEAKKEEIRSLLQLLSPILQAPK